MLDHLWLLAAALRGVCWWGGHALVGGACVGGAGPCGVQETVQDTVKVMVCRQTKDTAIPHIVAAPHARTDNVREAVGDGLGGGNVIWCPLHLASPNVQCAKRCIGLCAKACFACE